MYSCKAVCSDTRRVKFLIFTARKRSLWRLYFYTCLSVILFTGGWGVLVPLHGGIHPRAGTPPSRYTPILAGTPPGQVHPPAGTPPSQAGTPPGQAGTPWAGTPPGQAGTPPGQAGTPPLHSACWDTVNKRAVRIPLECNLVHNTFLTITWPMHFHLQLTSIANKSVQPLFLHIIKSKWFINKNLVFKTSSVPVSQYGS